MKTPRASTRGVFVHGILILNMDMYHFVLLATAFVLGVSIGSFLNVLIFRLRSGSRITGRSKCMSCGKTLTPRMLIPLFSYLLQRGRCAFCGSRIAIQYLLVEVLLGLLYVATILVRGFDPLQASFSETFFVLGDAVIWTTLLAITVYDLRHKIIPDSFSLFLALSAGVLVLVKWNLGVLPTSYVPFWETMPTWVDLLAGPLLATPFALLWFFSGGRAMGLGDAKIAWGIGWFLGFSLGISSVILAFWVAFFPSLALLLLRSRRFTMKSEIPFAPFFVTGTFLAYAFGINVLNWTF